MPTNPLLCFLPCGGNKAYIYKEVDEIYAHSFTLIYEPEGENQLIGKIALFSDTNVIFDRIKYPIKVTGIETDFCYLYVPTEPFLFRLNSEIELYLTPEERETLLASDLWLEYAQNKEPELLQKFPTLFHR